jgi:uncharacterized SAM-binding protein YcdF (DUF218 family)
LPTAYAAAFLLPPLAPLLLALAGFLVRKSRPRLAILLMVLGWGLIALLSTPFAGNGLLSLLEPPYEDPLRRPADAIVVLGAGMYVNAPEYGGADTVNNYSLERLRYAAQVYRRSNAPVLVTGGAPHGNVTSEAALMKAVLQDEWGIAVAWTESNSVNTLENARLTDAMLGPAGIRRIYLVTHAWHMPRARFAFERAGFDVIPAPTRYTTRFRSDLFIFLPSGDGMFQSAIFCRELLGLIWYRLLL